MNPPPDDEPSSGSETVDKSPATATEQPEDAIEPASRRSEETPHQPPAATSPDSQVGQQQAPRHSDMADVDSANNTAEQLDSTWWYWVAAVPVYVVGGFVAGVIATILFLLGVAVDIGGGMGIGTGAVMVLILLGTVVYGVVGLALSIMFPIGIYLDAKTIASADISWDPDPVLYLLVAVGSVLLTAFTLSFVVALYYLYRRNKAVGVP